MNTLKITGITKLAIDELGQSDIDQLKSMIPCDGYIDDGDIDLITMPDKETCHVVYLEYHPNN